MKSKAMLARSKKDDVVYAASSGGVFETLARVVIEAGGVVVGAAFDEDMVLRHRIVACLEELPPLLKSKYVRSDFVKVLPKVVHFLNQGKNVLFAGTPCMIAAVRKYCDEHKNLITVDVLCHGAPHPKYFAAWVQELEKNHGSRIVNYDFRCKEHGWSPLETRVDFKNGVTLYTKMDPYFFAFMNNFSIGKTCLHCQYSKSDRLGDLTLGDAWGLSKLWKQKDDNMGISVVLLNTKKGRRLFEKILPMLHVRAVSLKDVVRRQPEVLAGNVCKIRPECEIFKSIFDESSSLCSAVNQSIRFIRLNASEKKEELKNKIKKMRWKMWVPFLGKRMREYKKELRREIVYLESVLSFDQGDKN